jgi:hypothetical protein
MTKLFLTFASFFVVFGLASALRGDTVYIYQGNGYTTCLDGGTAPVCADLGGVSNSLDITLDLSAPLGDNFSGTFVVPNGWSVTDGNTTYSSTTAGNETVDFITDGSGNITGWSVIASNGVGFPILYSDWNDAQQQFGPLGVNVDASGMNNGQGNFRVVGLANTPGAWTVQGAQITATPEPAGVTAVLLAGLVGLEVWRKRKARLALGAIPDDEFDPNEPEPPGFEKRDTGALQAILEFEYLTSRGWICKDGRKFYHITEPTDPSRHTGWSMRDALTIQLNRDRIITGCEDPAAYSPLLGWLTADNEMVSRTPSPDSEPPPPPPPVPAVPHSVAA